MDTRLRRHGRFATLAILGAVFGFFAVLTIVAPDWLEAFGVDLDHGNGSLERLIAAVSSAAFAACVLSANRARVSVSTRQRQRANA